MKPTLLKETNSHNSMCIHMSICDIDSILLTWVYHMNHKVTLRIQKVALLNLFSVVATPLDVQGGSPYHVQTYLVYEGVLYIIYKMGIF